MKLGSICYVIVTYRQPLELRALYESILRYDKAACHEDIIIINNSQEFVSPPGAARILHNMPRPDTSLGNLAQSWNFGIVNALGSLKTPKYDWVALCQSDVVFRSGWKQRLQSHVDRHDCVLVSCAPGDQVTFIHHDAFRRVGWWDERFCGIGFQEFDYYLRAYLHLGPTACIEGHGHELVWNWPGLDLIERSLIDGTGHSDRLNGQLFGYFRQKWGG